MEAAFASGFLLLRDIQRDKTFLKAFPDIASVKVAYNFLNTEYERQFALNADKTKELQSAQAYKNRLDLVNTIVSYCMAAVFIAIGGYGLVAGLILNKKKSGGVDSGGKSGGKDSGSGGSGAPKPAE